MIENTNSNTRYLPDFDISLKPYREPGAKRIESIRRAFMVYWNGNNGHCFYRYFPGFNEHQPATIEICGKKIMKYFKSRYKDKSKSKSEIEDEVYQFIIFALNHEALHGVVNNIACSDCIPRLFKYDYHFPFYFGLDDVIGNKFDADNTYAPIQWTLMKEVLGMSNIFGHEYVITDEVH